MTTIKILFPAAIDRPLCLFVTPFWFLMMLVLLAMPEAHSASGGDLKVHSFPNYITYGTEIEGCVVDPNGNGLPGEKSPCWLTGVPVSSRVGSV